MKTLIKEHLPETIFFCITLISAATLIVPLWNYNQFYNALYNFSYTIPGVSVNASQLSAHTAQINFTVVATNPTGYTGLHVSSVTCEIYYYGTIEGQTNWWPLPTLYITKEYTLGPDSNTIIPIDFTINPNTAASGQLGEFISYLMTQVPGGTISWQLTCSVTIASFLGSGVTTEIFTPATPLS